LLTTPLSSVALAITSVALAIPRVALAIPWVAVAIPVVTRLVEFRPVKLAFAVATRRALKPLLALLPGLRFPARRPIAKILAETLARAAIPTVSAAAGKF